MKGHNPLYRMTAFIWAVVFALVGLSFLVAPEPVTRGLTSLGAWLGLSGVIPGPSGTLWHVLALSMMSCIIVLSVQTALDPRDPRPYAALLTAKLVSTAGFLWLALDGPVWLLAALGDGFVALTLWLTRRLGDPDPRPADFTRRYLQHMGASEGAPESYRLFAATLPGHIRLALGPTRWFFTYLAPLLLIGEWSTAGRLDEADFVRLCDRVRRTRWWGIHALWVLVLWPGIVALVEARVPGGLAGVSRSDGAATGGSGADGSGADGSGADV